MEANKYYLIKDTTTHIPTITEVYIIRKTKTSYHINFYYPNNISHPNFYEWVLVEDFDRKFRIVEELDNSYYRKEKFKILLDE